MISPAMIAALIFGACGLVGAAAVEFMLRTVAQDAGVNRWIFVAVPALFLAGSAEKSSKTLPPHSLSRKSASRNSSSPKPESRFVSRGPKLTAPF